MRHEVEQAERMSPEPERRAATENEVALASAVGNRALARAISSTNARHLRQLAREPDVPPAPVTLNAPAEKEKEALSDPAKERARKTCIAPLRAAAATLGAGPKANVASVVRHLRPVRTAVLGVPWPQEMIPQALDAIEDLQAVQMELESLKLDSRQNVVKIRALWASSRKTLSQASSAISKAGPDKKHPDREARADAPADATAITALSAQIEATSRDLAQAPRTQDGFKEVADTAVGVFEQFDTIQPPEAVGEMKFAKEQFKEGVAILAPLALGKEETFKQTAGLLTEMANKLAALVGDEAPAPEAKDDEPDPSAQPHFDPAPSPNPLPPPPPPPKQDKAPAGAAAP